MNPVLLLHGALGAPSQLEPLRQNLEQEGFTLHLVTFSGHSGKMFKNNFGIQTFSEDVLDLLDTLKIGKADIFGYSMGGYVALWTASQAPARVGKIVTLGTKFDWSPATADQEIKKLDPIKIQEKVPAFARLLQQRHFPADWKDLLHRTANMMKNLGNKPLLTEDVLVRIKQDALVLLGDEDDMAGLDASVQVAEGLPHGIFQLLDNTPHPIEKVDIERLAYLVKRHFRPSKKP